MSIHSKSKSYSAVLQTILFVMGTHLAFDRVCLAQEAISGRYFGSKLPGNTAEPFAPAFFAKAGRAGRFGMAISDDGHECYYAAAFKIGEKFHEEIRFTRFENGAWKKEQSLLSDEKYKCVDPHLSPDQSRLYFIYTKPAVSEGAPERPVFDIWYVNREEDGWGEPVNVGAPVSSMNAEEYYISLTTEGTLYFGSNRANNRNFDLYSASLNSNGSYSSPKLLKGEVNTKNYEADVFVAPDESYIIFCSNGRKGGLGRGDLYISFRNSDGTWPEAINMGERVNTEQQEFAPSVSRDGKYLFFSRSGNIHWVDSSVIEELRPKKND